MTPFTQTGKMTMPSDYDKLCIHVIPKAATKKAIQRETKKHYREIKIDL